MLQTVAHVLAALILLDHASPTSALAIFLKARTQALASVLAPPPAPRGGVKASTSTSTSKPPAAGVHAVQVKLGLALDCVVRTVEAVDAIFPTDANDDDDAPPRLLAHVLRELEHPSASAAEPSSSSSSSSSSKNLTPILTSLPNYPTLARHLPSSILSYNPFLASGSSSSSSSSSTSTSLASWLEGSTKALVSGLSESIAALVSSDDHPAVALATLRDSILHHLKTPRSSGPTTTAAVADEARGRLGTELVALIESRLHAVYTATLSDLVEQVEPSLRSLLVDVVASSSSEEGEDPAKFLFSIEPPPPPQQQQQQSSSSNSNSVLVSVVDPFSAFLNKVGKRVEGRTPLVDRGLEPLERRARELRTDLESTWLGEHDRLRDKYVEQVAVALERIVDGLDRVLVALEEEEAQTATTDDDDDHAIGKFPLPSLSLSEARPRISKLVFVGTFARHLARSRTFTRDLLLGIPSSSGNEMLSTWQARLADLERRSLERWQADAVRRATSFLSTPTTTTTTTTTAAAAAARVGAPSRALVLALDSLLRSVHALPLDRLYASSESGGGPATALVAAFSSAALDVVAQLLLPPRASDEDDEDAESRAWDATLIGLIVRHASSSSSSSHAAADAPGESSSSSSYERWDNVAARFAARRTVSEEEGTGSAAAAAASRTQSATRYLLRTQSVYAPLLLSSSSPTTITSSSSLQRPRTTAAPTNDDSRGGGARTAAAASRLLLPLGPPPTVELRTGGGGGGVLGFVPPGARRIGLLPTKG
ncbi:hypothetical protein JCM11491_005154 [Sporobolomyces phaffii]